MEKEEVKSDLAKSVTLFVDKMRITWEGVQTPFRHKYCPMTGLTSEGVTRSDRVATRH